MQLHYIPDKVELMFGFSKNVNKWKTFQTTLIEAKCHSPSSPKRLYFFPKSCKNSDAWPGNQQISAPGYTPMNLKWLYWFQWLCLDWHPGHWEQGLCSCLHPAWLQVLPSDNLVSLRYGDPARKGEVVLVPPKLSQCPWHDACGYCLISYCWQLKHKHIVIFLDETVQTFQNSLCMQICMLSESTTHAHGIYGKCWEIWKEIIWEVVLFFWT